MQSPMPKRLKKKNREIDYSRLGLLFEVAVGKMMMAPKSKLVAGKKPKWLNRGATGSMEF